MNIDLVRANKGHIKDYIRIARQNISRFNIVATDPQEVQKEIEGSSVYMIKLGDCIVGFVSYKIVSLSHVYISEVQVEPEFQSKGVGGKAFKMILRNLEGTRTIDLHTHPESRAQFFYKRHGFQQTGDVIQNYHNSGEPRIRMVRGENKTIV